MLKSFTVSKKPMAAGSSGLVTSFPSTTLSLGGSSFVILSPSNNAPNKRGNGNGNGTTSGGVSHKLRVASPKATAHSSSVNKITPTAPRQFKKLTDSLTSDTTAADEDENSDDEYDEGGLDVVSKLMKYVGQLVEKADVKSPGMVLEDCDDDEPSDEVVRQYMKYMDLLMMQKRGDEKSGNYVKKDDGAMYVRTEMPGLSKEDVTVTVEKNMLVIKGEEKKAGGDDEKGSLKYNGSVKLETEVYKIGEIKAEMKNGVLMLVVPKLKEEERKDIIHVKVD